MKILAIETSCDESALAVLEFDGGGFTRILAEVISSQVSLHQRYGGVVPELASREHLAALPILLEEVLRDGATTLDQLSAIAVTRGAGLKGCLLVGVDFAKGLGVARGLPLIGVNHIEGHLLAPRLDNPELQYPYLALVVSGGHTEIVQVEGLGRYTLLARTSDDAAGEAFDKSANLLGLAYPGGAKLAELADSVRGEAIPGELRLPKVMREAPGFSFSGLKTAIATLVRREETRLREDERWRALLASSVQEAIVDTLVHKLHRAILESGVTRVAVTGGVSANHHLRRQVASLSVKRTPVMFFAPTFAHCTDNGAMIGYAGGLRFLEGERMALRESVISRWPVETVSQVGS